MADLTIFCEIDKNTTTDEVEYSVDVRRNSPEKQRENALSLYENFELNYDTEATSYYSYKSESEVMSSLGRDSIRHRTTEELHAKALEVTSIIKNFRSVHDELANDPDKYKDLDKKRKEFLDDLSKNFRAYTDPSDPNSLYRSLTVKEAEELREIYNKLNNNTSDDSMIFHDELSEDLLSVLKDQSSAYEEADYITHGYDLERAKHFMYKVLAEDDSMANQFRNWSRDKFENGTHKKYPTESLLRMMESLSPEQFQRIAESLERRGLGEITELMKKTQREKGNQSLVSAIQVKVEHGKGKKGYSQLHTAGFVATFSTIFGAMYKGEGLPNFLSWSGNRALRRSTAATSSQKLTSGLLGTNRRIRASDWLNKHGGITAGKRRFLLRGAGYATSAGLATVAAYGLGKAKQGLIDSRQAKYMDPLKEQLNRLNAGDLELAKNVRRKIDTASDFDSLNESLESLLSERGSDSQVWMNSYESEFGSSYLTDIVDICTSQENTPETRQNAIDQILKVMPASIEERSDELIALMNQAKVSNNFSAFNDYISSPTFHEGKNQEAIALIYALKTNSDFESDLSNSSLQLSKPQKDIILVKSQGFLMEEFPNLLNDKNEASDFLVEIFETGKLIEENPELTGLTPLQYRTALNALYEEKHGAQIEDHLVSKNYINDLDEEVNKYFGEAIALKRIAKVKKATEAFIEATTTVVDVETAKNFLADDANKAKYALYLRELAILDENEKQTLMSPEIASKFKYLEEARVSM